VAPPLIYTVSPALTPETEVRAFHAFAQVVPLLAPVAFASTYQVVALPRLATPNTRKARRHNLATIARAPPRATETDEQRCSNLKSFIPRLSAVPMAPGRVQNAEKGVRRRRSALSGLLLQFIREGDRPSVVSGALCNPGSGHKSSSLV